MVEERKERNGGGKGGWRDGWRIDGGMNGGWRREELLRKGGKKDGWRRQGMHLAKSTLQGLICRRHKEGETVGIQTGPRVF